MLLPKSSALNPVFARKKRSRLEPQISLVKALSHSRQPLRPACASHTCASTPQIVRSVPASRGFEEEEKFSAHGYDSNKTPLWGRATIGARGVTSIFNRRLSGGRSTIGMDVYRGRSIPRIGISPSTSIHPPTPHHHYHQQKQSKSSLSCLARPFLF